MKSSIIIVVLELISVGCSTTTYLSLTENDKETVRRELNVYEKGDYVGAEVTIVLDSGKEVEGELLSVRDSALILCTEYAATENELVNSVYPVTLVKNYVIKELTFEGSSYVWTGIAVGALAGSIAGGLTGKEVGYAALLFFPLGIVVGSITGYALSTEEFILYEIPAGYRYYFFKDLARYEEVEPEYLNLIK